MKAMGSIPPGFVANTAGHLMIGGHDCTELVERAGDTPLFVYDFGFVRNRVAELRNHLPASVRLHYAMKANPLPEMVEAMAPLVDGLDVASGGELAIALPNSQHISFAGPGKRDRELELAITNGATLNLESEGETDRANGRHP